MSDFRVRPLSTETWADFARLVEDHNGVWGGCWCMGFHPEGAQGARTVAERRSLKEARVRDGTAHAALVFDGDACIGWCQYGPTEELPRIKSRKAYSEGLTALPDWRITCFFVAKSHRGRGVADAALAGALRQIADLGGGTVESYPENVEGRTTSGAFLHNATLGMFERHGFARTRRIGKNRWVVARIVGA